MRVTVHLSHSQLVVLSYSLFYIKIGIYGQWKCKSTVTGEVVFGGGVGGVRDKFKEREPGSENIQFKSASQVIQ